MRRAGVAGRRSMPATQRSRNIRHGRLEHRQALQQRMGQQRQEGVELQLPGLRRRA